MHVKLRKMHGNACGNVLDYGLSIFVDFEKFPYHSIILISGRFNKLSQLLVGVG